MSEEVKAGAAAYLLERFADARMNSRSLFRFFLRNAQTKHGVPAEAEQPQSSAAALALAQALARPQKQEHAVTVNGSLAGITPPTATGSPSAAARGTGTTGAAGASQSSGRERDWWRLTWPLLAAAGLGGVGLVGYGLGQRGKGDVAAYEESDTNIGVDIYEADRSQSPLQWLEDEGQNRP